MFCYQNLPQLPKINWYQLCHLVVDMNWSRTIRRTFVILVLYGIAIAEVYYLPRYGVEWLIGGLALTAILAGHWMRANWSS